MELTEAVLILVKSKSNLQATHHLLLMKTNMFVFIQMEHVRRTEKEKLWLGSEFGLGIAIHCK